MNVELAPSVDAAIEHCQLREAPFDMVLSDYRLDHLDGIELAKRLPNHSYVQGAYVLMAIARQLPNQDQLAEAGITLVLEKPITNALLYEAVLQALDVQRHKEDDIAAIDGSQLQVLVADDNQVNQLLTTAMLKKFGISPDIAADGLLAVEQYDQKNYDLILMDCEMPVLDGFEACKQIRTKEKLFNKEPVMIVAISAHARSDFQSKALKAGMDDYLTKPLTQTALAGVLQTLGR
jgi:CheY-like chemotaxis protein